VIELRQKNQGERRQSGNVRMGASSHYYGVAGRCRIEIDSAGWRWRDINEAR
jgi:hypothetical protein